MASRRCFTTLTRLSFNPLFSKSNSLHSLKSLTSPLRSLQCLPHTLSPQSNPHSFLPRYFSSHYTSGEEEREVSNEPSNLADRSYFVEDKIEEAAHIGYKVIGPLLPTDRVFKPYEPAFAVVQVGSHQFKVSNGDCIYVEKLKYCEVNDK
ncbi:hypothetical protein SOVF_058780, partial [Spinacia oleracea]